MNKFKGDDGEWRCVFTAKKKRAIRNNGHLICVFTEPSKFSGQDERYERELIEAKYSQILMAAAPDLLKALQELSSTGFNIHTKDQAESAINKALGI